MPDNQDPLSIPAQRQVAEEPADARDGLPPAFPARTRRVQMLETASVQLGRRRPVALPIVTFAEPPVIEHRNRGLAEGGGGCLGSATEVGAEDGGEPVAHAPVPELPGLHPALL
jgi:hypothetical protein